jgi:hypothetical protein
MEPPITTEPPTTTKKNPTTTEKKPTTTIQPPTTTTQPPTTTEPTTTTTQPPTTTEPTTTQTSKFILIFAIVGWIIVVLLIIGVIAILTFKRRKAKIHCSEELVMN